MVVQHLRESLASLTTVGNDHGGIETRRALSVKHIDWLPDVNRKDWPTMGAIGMVETTQEGRGEHPRGSSLFHRQ